VLRYEDLHPDKAKPKGQLPSADEIAKMGPAMFAHLDKDEDGELTRQELAPFNKEGKGRRDAFETMDVSPRDGKVTAKEVAKYLAHVQAARIH